MKRSKIYPISLHPSHQKDGMRDGSNDSMSLRVRLLDPGLTCVQNMCRLLDPELESSGSFFVGNYILQLILNLPSQMGQHIRDLVCALVRRMQSCGIAGLKNSLLLVFARLVLH